MHKYSLNYSSIVSTALRLWLLGAQKILEVIVCCGSVSIYLDALERVVLFGSPAAFVQVFGTLGACVHVNRQAAVFLIHQHRWLGNVSALYPKACQRASKACQQHVIHQHRRLCNVSALDRNSLGVWRKNQGISQSSLDRCKRVQVSKLCMLLYADVCWRMLTYAHTHTHRKVEACWRCRGAG